MKAKKKRTSRKAGPGRQSFPQDEKKLPWLPLLLDAYHAVDRGVAGAVASEQKKGRSLACAKGCSHCCSTHKDIPVYPLELKGMVWFVMEKTSGTKRETLTQQLALFKKDDPCPFLILGACAIHAVRPMACRQFNVFGSPCGEGEDPYYSRRGDVMDPVKRHVDQAFFIMLPFHGVEKHEEKVRVIDTGSFHKMVRELHSCDWKHLAAKMGSGRL